MYDIVLAYCLMQLIHVFTATHSSNLRMGRDIQDMRDGSYAFRYRLVKSVLHDDVELIISVTGSKMLVAASPYILSAPLYSEMCSCATVDLSVFLSRLDCQVSSPQIDADFAAYSSIDMQKYVVDFEAYAAKYKPSVCRYIVKNNLIYRKCYGIDGFRFFSDKALASLARKARLPDLDFIMNLGDWPLANIRQNINLPIISWCGSNTTQDIVIPTYEVRALCLLVLLLIFLLTCVSYIYIYIYIIVY